MMQKPHTNKHNATVVLMKNWNIKRKTVRSKLRMKKRTGRKKIIWFNSHSSLSVKTNIGIFFKKNSKKHFLKANPLSKIFNKNTKRISYSCTRNMKQHNLIIKLTSHAILTTSINTYIYIYIYIIYIYIKYI